MTLFNRRGPRTSQRPPLLVPLVGLSLATVVLCGTGVERAVSGAFFDPVSHRWPLHGDPVLRAIDRYGAIPAAVLSGAGLLALAAALVSRSVRRWWRSGLFLAATVIVGNLFLINVCLKGVWDRPRPIELEEFGGQAAYQPVWRWGGNPGRHKSFPSGHASAGFLVMAPGFLFYGRRRGLAWVFFAAGIALGGVMGASRLVQGSHFVTDVLWAGGVTYAACVRLAWRTLPRDANCHRPDNLENDST